MLILSSVASRKCCHTHEDCVGPFLLETVLATAKEDDHRSCSMSSFSWSDSGGAEEIEGRKLTLGDDRLAFDDAEKLVGISSL